jgi:SAM-dependent methyltransferase
VYKRKISPHLKPSTEAFSQKENFVLKYGDHVHDTMYCDNYEKIHKIKTHIPQQIDILLKTTQPSKDDTLLDIESNTGYVVNELTQRGYNAYGVTPIDCFLKYCNTKYPDAIVKQGNIRNPMEYEKGVFTHIFALYYSIYNYNHEDKLKILKNCYSWMKPGGYLVLHLVDVNKFDITTPIAKDPIFGSLQKQHFTKNMQKEKTSTPSSRLTEFEVDFQDMTYKSVYNFNRLTTTNEVIITETMKNKGNEKIRQNEKIQYMESIDQIVQMANQCGFIAKSTLKLKEILDDEYQFLYIFERTL